MFQHRFSSTSRFPSHAAKRMLCLLATLLGLALAAPAAYALTLNNFHPANLVLGQPNFTSNAAATTQSGMQNPVGVAVDRTTGKLFVADWNNNRVLRFASGAALANGAAAEAVLGQPNFTSNAAATTQSGMQNPAGVVVDGTGRLWVADAFNHRVLRFDNAAAKLSGANADGVLGQPNFTSNAATTTQSGMNRPYTLAVDAAGRLWVVEFLNNRVLRFNNAAAKANGANADGVLGQPNFTSNASATTQSGMANPAAVALDGAGRLWVADYTNNRVLRFDNAAAKANGANADGVLGQPNFTSNAAAATQSGMNGLFGLTVDGTGRLYTMEFVNNRGLWFDNAAAKANGANADGVLGQPNFTSSTANAGGLSDKSLNSPVHAFYDPAADVLWVADYSNNRVLRYVTNTPPTISSISNQTIAEDSSTGALNFTIGDTETPASSLTVTGSSSNTTLVPNGNIVFGGSGTNRTVTVTPAPNQNGSATITLTLTDGVGATATTSFILTVNPLNDPPTVANVSKNGLEDAAIAFAASDFSGQFSDVDGDSLSKIQVTSLPANGTLKLSGVNVTLNQEILAAGLANLTFTPDADWNGGTSFGWNGHDGTIYAATSAQVTITIAAVNDAPSFTKGADQTVNEDAGAQSVSGWASSISAGPVNESAQAVSFLVLNDNNALFAVQPAVGSNGTLSYTSDANANGSATVTVSAQDNGGTSGGGVNTSAPSTFVITVNPVNDAPVLAAIGDRTVAEGSALSFSASATDADQPANTLTYSLDAGAPAGATIDPATGAFSWTPGEADGPGTYTVIVRVTDDSTPAAEDFETIQITVGEINNAPVLSNTGAGPELATIDEDATTNTGNTVASLAMGTGVSITDADNVAVKGLAITAANTTDGAWQFSVNDGTSWSAVPAVADNQALLLAANGITRIRFAPNTNYNGTASLTFRAWDQTSGTNGSLADTTANGGSTAFSTAADSALITITPVNDAPTLDPIVDVSILESAPAQTVNLRGISAGPANENGQTLTLTASSSNPALIPNPVVTYNNGSTTGTLSFTPTAGLSGSATIIVTVTDSGNNLIPSAYTFVRAFVVFVGAVNNRPTLTQPADLSILEDAGAQTVNLSGISTGSPQESSQRLMVTASSSNPALVPNPVVTYSDGSPIGTLSLTPVANASGMATITVRVRDDGGTANGGIDIVEQIFVVEVKAVNDAPNITVDAYLAVRSTAGAQALAGWARGFVPGPADEAGQTILEYRIVGNTNPDLFAVAPALAADGTLTYTPKNSASGTVTISLVVRDSGGTANGGVDTSTVRTFTMTIVQSYLVYQPLIVR